MPEAPYFSEEAKRLAALERSRMMGTPAEERFDKITRMARRLLNVPLAVIDIVGEQISWIKSGQGLNDIIGLRKDAYCFHTILNEGLCIIEDARTDPRVFDSRYAETWVSYAGAPISFEGQRIGVLCVGDYKPRQFTHEDQETLLDLASMVEQEFKICALSSTQIQLAQGNEELEKSHYIDSLTHGWNSTAILNIISTECAKNDLLGLLMIDVDYFKQAHETYGHLACDQLLRVIAERIRSIIPPTEAIGRYKRDVFLVVLTQIKRSEVLLISQQIGSKITQHPIYFENKTIPVSCSIGCAMQEKKEGSKALIHRAHQALIKVKKAGRNGISF